MTTASVVRFWVAGMVLMLLAGWWFELVGLSRHLLRCTAALRTWRERLPPETRHEVSGEYLIRNPGRRLVREREVAAIAWLLAPWGMMAAGIALTFPVGSQRLVVLTSIWALAAGSGVGFLARWLGTLPFPHAVVVPSRLARIGAGSVIAVVAMTNSRTSARVYRNGSDRLESGRQSVGVSQHQPA